MRTIFYLNCLLLAVAFPAMAQERKGDVWPLNTCAVTGEELGSMGDPVIKVYDGREVRFCCAGCIKTFEKSKATLLPKADAAILEAQRAAYPLETCLNSGEPLGEKPAEAVVGNRLVKACCKDCLAALQKDPAATVEKLNKAVIAKQKPAYKGTACPVSDHKVEGEGVDAVIAGTYLKLCCKDCVAGAEKAPAAAIAKATGAAEKK